jgi:hypothetical protein
MYTVWPDRRDVRNIDREWCKSPNTLMQLKFYLSPVNLFIAFYQLTNCCLLAKYMLRHLCHPNAIAETHWQNTPVN